MILVVADCISQRKTKREALMRVVGGSARGRKLLLVPGQGTRPILDRVKTALFDILRPDLSGMRVLDLFAGSGSVGIEALSQGAEFCTFTEQDHRAAVTIRKNLEITGLSNRSEVLQTDAFSYLKTAKKQFDLIYVAPPQSKNLWIRAMHQLGERPELLSRGTDPTSDLSSGLVIVQIDPREYQRLDLGIIQETRQKRYGNTMLVFYKLSSSTASRKEET
jgi:16S rRNA (guanine(966)-N(2))-methyltransferase RsmD